LDVQRQDEQGTAQSLAPAAQGPVSIGTLVIPSTSQGGDAPLPPITVVMPDATAGALVNQAPAVVAAAGMMADDLVAAASGVLDVGVSTGPLASRSAAPLGPILGAADADPVPPVDRHERGLFQEIAGPLWEGATGTTQWRDELTSRGSPAIPPIEGQSSDSDSTGGTVVAVSSGGGFPRMATAISHGRRTDRAALLDSVPSTTGPDTPRPDATAVERSTDLDEAARADQSPASSDQIDVPDYVKAACGLALGLGLTAGPLFPDQVNRVPPPLPEWLRKFPANGRNKKRPFQG
jgi:hypothetical protein